MPLSNERNRGKVPGQAEMKVNKKKKNKEQGGSVSLINWFGSIPRQEENKTERCACVTNIPIYHSHRWWMSKSASKRFGYHMRCN